MRKNYKKPGGLTNTQLSNQIDMIIEMISDSSIGGSSYDNPNPVNQTIGGVESGTTFFAGGKNLGQIMASMFFPTLFPTLTSPSNGFSNNILALQEIGDSLNIQFTGIFNRGSINPAYGTSGFRSGLPNTYHYTGTGLPGSISETSLSNIQNVVNYIVLIGIQTWTSAISYDAGEQPKDSEGNDFDNPLPTGTTGYVSSSFEGVYPLFGTTSSISNPDTQQPLVSMLSGNNVTFNMMTETGGDKQSFDIPDAWTGAPTNRSLVGVETYNTVSLSWEYQGGSAGASLTYWTSSANTHTIQGNVINYTRYSYNSDDRGDIQIRLKF